MSHKVEGPEGPDSSLRPSRQNAMDMRRQMLETFKNRAQANSGNNTTRENSNDRLNNSTLGAEAGADNVVAAQRGAVTSAQNSSGSNSGGSQQDSSKGNTETVVAYLDVSSTASSSGDSSPIKAGNQFEGLFNLNPEEIMLNRRKSDIFKRHPNLPEPLRDAVNQMQDMDSLNKANATLHTRMRELNAGKLQESDIMELKATIQAGGDSFDVVSTEEIQQQQQQNQA